MAIARLHSVRFMEPRDSTTTGSGQRGLAGGAIMLAPVPLGGILAFQTRSNGALGAGLHDGVAAAAIVFVIGLVLLGIGMVLIPKGRAGLHAIASSLRARTMPLWMLSGGAAGALYVITQGWVGAVLGTAIFTVAAVAGQTLAGLMLDRTSISPSGPRRLSARRVGGALLGLVAVGVAVSHEVGGSIPPWALLLPVIGGLAIGWQQAVNGRVGVVAGTPLTSTFLNFAIGSAVLVVIVVVRGVARGFPTSLPGQAWVYLGGVTAVFFVVAATVVVRRTGVLTLALGTVAGQLVASLLIELIAPTAGHTIGWTTVAGTALALVAVVVATELRLTPPASRTRTRSVD